MSAKPSRTRAFARNAVASAFYQVIMMLSGFIVPRVLLVHYGSEANGLVSSIGQFISCFYLVEAGLSGASVFALYKPIANGDRRAISGILSGAQKLYRQTGCIFSILILALAILYPCLKTTNILMPPLVGLLVFALSARSLLEFFAIARHRVFLIASQKMWVISLISSLAQVLHIAILVVAARQGANLLVLNALAILPVLLRSFLIAFYVRRHAPDLDFKAPPRMEALKKRWDVLYLQMLNAAQSSAPIILATLFTSLATVSVYAVHNMVLHGISAVLSIFISGLPASFGDVIARGEKEILKRATREFEAAYYAIIAFFFSVTAVMITPFVSLYTSDINDIDYVQPLLGFLMALNGLLYCLKTPQGMLVIAAGLYRETRVQSTVQGAIIVVFGLILTPFFGLIGLAVSMILSNVYRTIDLAIFIPRHLTHLPVREGVWRILQTLGTSAIIFLPCYWVGVNPKTPIEWVRDAVLVSAWAALVTIGINLLFQRQIILSLVRRVKLTFGVTT